MVDADLYQKCVLFVKLYANQTKRKQWCIPLNKIPRVRPVDSNFVFA